MKDGHYIGESMFPLVEDKIYHLIGFCNADIYKDHILDMSRLYQNDKKVY